MKKNSLNKTTSIWFCGLSGAGKTTISLELKKVVETKTDTGVVLLDGDELVELFSSSSVDRSEQARIERVKKYTRLVSILLRTPRILPVVVMINHSHKLREMIKNSSEIGEYFEVYLNASLSTCEERDPKGHYKKSKESATPLMIGVDLPFDIPQNPDVVVNERVKPTDAAELIFNKLCERGIFV